MKRWIAALVSVTTIAAAAASIYYFCVLPLRCSVAERRLEDLTLQMAEYPHWPGTTQHALSNLQEANRCIEARPAEVNLYLIAAVNCRLLGQDTRAVELYKEALRYDQRPEIYAGLGNAQSAIGKRREAVENLLRANIFWPYTLNDIEDPFVHDEVERRFNEYEAALKGSR